MRGWVIHLAHTAGAGVAGTPQGLPHRLQQCRDDQCRRTRTEVRLGQRCAPYSGRTSDTSGCNSVGSLCSSMRESCRDSREAWFISGQSSWSRVLPDRVSRPATIALRCGALRGELELVHEDRAQGTAVAARAGRPVQLPPASRHGFGASCSGCKRQSNRGARTRRKVR